MRKLLLAIVKNIKDSFNISTILRNIGFIVVILSLCQFYHFTIKPKNKAIDSLNPIRHLSESQMEIENEDIGINESIDLKGNKLIEQEFILNITQIPYQGNWSVFTFPNKEFDNNSGEAEVTIYKYPLIKNHNYSHSGNSHTIMLSLMIKDGKYLDHFFKGNITITLPQDIISRVITNKPFTIDKIQGMLSYYQGDLFENYGYTIINTTLVTITFYPTEKHFDNGLMSSYNLWSTISLLITDPREGISISLLCEMNIPSDNQVIIFNYTLILTFISFFQIYHSLSFLLEVNDNPLTAFHTELISLSIQILWNSLLCAVHFFIAISDEKNLYNFVCPSMTYFILFSIFELKILFIVWKAKFDYLIDTDIALFRKKLLQFYLLFYFMLFTSMISLRFWYNHFGLGYLFFVSGWLFQIYFSAKEGTKPPMSYEYIFWFTLGKIVFPIFLKGGSDGNIINLKPAYTKVICITIMAFIEMIILMLQKLIGPQFFLPKFMRKTVFDYYKEYHELLDKTNDCVICLERLSKGSNINMCIVQDDLNNEKIVSSPITNSEYFIYDYIAMIINKLKKIKIRKPYMVTPCFHEFHTPCLEKWIQCKTECPYCRRILPLYDD